MCLAIYKPKGKAISRSALSNGFTANPHGAGFAYRDKKNELQILKGFFTFEDFWKAFEHHKNYDCVVHFRLATHGEKTLENCHPWSLLDGKLAMIHNGILGVETNEGEWSDTGVFANTILQPLLAANPNLWLSPAFKELVTMAVGTYNKLVFMDCHGNHLIINEGAGHWEAGVWYSNSSHKPQHGFDWRSWSQKKLSAFPPGDFPADNCAFPDYTPAGEEDYAGQVEAEYWQMVGYKRAEDLRAEYDANEVKWSKVYKSVK